MKQAIACFLHESGNSYGYVVSQDGGLHGISVPRFIFGICCRLWTHLMFKIRFAPHIRIDSKDIPLPQSFNSYLKRIYVMFRQVMHPCHHLAKVTGFYTGSSLC